MILATSVALPVLDVINTERRESKFFFSSLWLETLSLHRERIFFRIDCGRVLNTKLDDYDKQKKSSNTLEITIEINFFYSLSVWPIMILPFILCLIEIMED